MWSSTHHHHHLTENRHCAAGRETCFLVVALVMETHCKNDTEVPIHIAHNKSITRKRNIAKREIICTEEEYILNDQCCMKCRRGHVKSTECPNTQAHCVPCKSGEEYMDHTNDLDKCMRCRSCDTALGWKVVKNCTPTENAECSCAKNHYCKSPQCEYCELCTVCENGLVEKECTSTTDTVCRMQEAGMPPWGTALIVLFVVALAVAAGLILYRKRKQKNFITQGNTGTGRDSSSETFTLISIDDDLSRHIPDIVREMTLDEVKTFVRHHQLSEPTIDEIIQDNFNNASEQKIKLFQKWHQRHGIRGAYETLISSLRDLKMRAVADKIEEKLKAAVSSHQERRESYNDKTGQSNSCSQEGGKSYHDNAEISKTYPESLEET
uniref:Tumor necrosis factor receptor superfamily member 6 n=2 Tax=Meleagris gallopavo TaxID=9103 RepID=A0A803Y9U9_MELGA